MSVAMMIFSVATTPALAVAVKDVFAGDVDLVSSPEDGTIYAPSWRVIVGERTLYIGQKGDVRMPFRR